jgi:tRNA U34 5-carboxymethylaminomethyl modifying enzyme MnmG/GidA
VKELNKTIQNLKVEIKTIRKSQRETTLQIENLGKRTGVIDSSNTKRIQDTEERISGAEYTIKTFAQQSKKMQNAKCEKLLDQTIQEIEDTIRRPNLRIVVIKESEDSQLKGPVNILN